MVRKNVENSTTHHVCSMAGSEHKTENLFNFKFSVVDIRYLINSSVRPFLCHQNRRHLGSNSSRGSRPGVAGNGPTLG